MTTVKSLLVLAAALAAVFYGLRFQKDREIVALQSEYAGLSAKATELAKNTSVAQAKLEETTRESAGCAEVESKHTACLDTITAEQKKIEELKTKWPTVEAARAAAVAAVRGKETSRPPTTITLADGTKLNNFVVRGVPNENTISVEHSSGLVKLSPDKLPTDLRTRLGFGWKTEAPPTLIFDRDGTASIKQAQQATSNKDAADNLDEELNLAELNLTTITGLSKAIALVENLLFKTQTAYDAERANIRHLGIFKPDHPAPGGKKTYGEVRKDANLKLAALAGKVQALRVEQSNLKEKLKSL